MLWWKEKLRELRKKAGIKNICLLLLAVGLLLLSFSDQLFVEGEPVTEQTTEEGTISEQSETNTGTRAESEMEEKLEEVLAAVKGVGKVRVMITMTDYGQKEVLKDEQTTTNSLNETDASGGSRVDISSQQQESTVFDSEDQPFITRETAAQVAGILVICEGGKNADIVFEIVSATEALFGVPAHRIVVLEMK